MNKRLFFSKVFTFLSLAISPTAIAGGLSEGWVYIVHNNDGSSVTYRSPPVDLTYPKPGHNEQKLEPHMVVFYYKPPADNPRLLFERARFNDIELDREDIYRTNAKVLRDLPLDTWQDDMTKSRSEYIKGQ